MNDRTIRSTFCGPNIQSILVEWSQYTSSIVSALQQYVQYVSRACAGIVMDCFQKELIDHVLEPLSDPRYGAHVDGSGRSQPVQNMLLVPLQVSY